MNLFFFQFWRLLIICGTKRSSEILDSVSKQRKAYSSPFRHRVRYLLWNGVSFYYSSYLVQLLYLLEINICLETPLVCLYPKLIESNDVNWLENAAWDENKLKGNRCRPSRACARRDRQGWESKTQVINVFFYHNRMLEVMDGSGEAQKPFFWYPPFCPCEAGFVSILQTLHSISSQKHFSAKVKKTKVA